MRVVAGLLQRDDKILIAKRPPNKPYAGYWELPGGKIEAQESSFAALKRELKEEIAINVLEAKCWFSHGHQYPDKSIFLELWYVNAYEGEPKPLEQQVLHWANFSDISQLQVLEGNIVLFAKLKQMLAQ